MTYAALAGLFLLVPALVLIVTVVLRRPGARWWATTGVTVLALLALTLVFDNVMIAADLFRYTPSQLHGLRLGLVPLEDLAWPLAVGILLPALQLLLFPGPTVDR